MGISANFHFSRSGFNTDLSLTLPRNGITVLLGPSGGGKTTILRVLAGLEKPQTGVVTNGATTWFNHARKVNFPPQKRRIGMVFQDYALFSHLTVAGNIGYGLPRKDKHDVVNKWLERLHLTPYAHRYVDQLSGGQRQRVALARALAPEPDLLLMDEPFSAIDVSLRQRLRRELRELVKGLHRPVVLVTHDLEEARMLADHICVVAGGRVLRTGPAEEVFNEPCSREVAEVLGWCNFIPVNLLRESFANTQRDNFNCDDIQCQDIQDDNVPESNFPQAKWYGVRPEHLRFTNTDQIGIPVKVMSIFEKGAVREVECRCKDGTVLQVHRPWDEPVPAQGSRVNLFVSAQHLRMLGNSAVVNELSSQHNQFPSSELLVKP